MIRIWKYDDLEILIASLAKILLVQFCALLSRLEEVIFSEKSQNRGSHLWQKILRICHETIWIAHPVGPLFWRNSAKLRQIY